MTVNLYDHVESIPDFPEKGIVFRDILPLMANGEAFKQATAELAQFARERGVEMVVGPEARGFIVGCPIAYDLGVGFAPARKKGKLPRPAVSATYDLEYGSATLQMEHDAIKPGQKVLVVDDLLATGGTILATIDLVEQMGGIVVGCAFLVDLKDLHGMERLKDYDVKALMEFSGE
ncbi:Adenine phosphoribosyltransferase [Limosilactobacillus gastricus PS3]|uniref:Adenine phosphoribosyltransferase n=2 Tax=Limosilactobacillus gastricus TaxID=227942 RepID=H4GL31_9LACO|nr:adenine phosphoribosyltransferase [Limosilactobacillus gastricus]EHS84661.1 Adenine phosphoribosyltransferase [Limosilactobacillus gastricus PS3]KRM02805.1 Adenine phosphoribosyltransferase [Limosilactobacillus gastricus DSM 16045]